MKHKIEKLLFILKGKTIGWSPSGDALNYEKYIFKEKVDKKISKEDLKKQIELLVKDDEISQQTIINQRQEIERLNNIINRTTKYVQSLSSKGRGCDIYEDIKQEILKELKGSDKE